MSPDLEKWLRSLPKAETHLHLEGAVPYGLYRKYVEGLPTEVPYFWGDEFRYQSFDEFNGALLSCALPFFNSIGRYREAARAVFIECVSQGVRYLEISFHLGVVAGIDGVHPEEVIEAILGEVPDGLEVRVYAGLLHNDYNGVLREWIDEAPGWAGLHGFDLHGPEDLPFEEWTPRVWESMREAGKRNRAHAGEFRGAEFVSEVVESLGVDRVAHGVRAIEKREVLDLILTKGVTLDVCPISNLKLGVEGVKRMGDHPIRRLFDEGISLTVSSDDPTFFGNRLIDDYAALYYDCGFSLREIGSVVKNGLRVADIAEPDRRALIADLDEILGRLREDKL